MLRGDSGDRRAAGAAAETNAADDPDIADDADADDVLADEAAASEPARDRATAALLVVGPSVVPAVTRSGLRRIGRRERGNQDIEMLR